MAWRALTTIFDNLSMAAISRRLDKRRLQHELDMHRLYLLTRFHELGGLQGRDAEEFSAELAAEADAAGFEESKAAVARALQAQVDRAAACLLQDLPGSASAAALGRARAPTTVQAPVVVGSLGRRPVASGPSGVDARQEPAGSDEAVQPLGFRLETAPSGIRHAAAGLGVWLRGRASVGQVVGFYPGVVYRPLHHRSIPGYPMVATDNEFLLSRLDGAALDGKPWGLGRFGSAAWPPHPPQNRAEELLAQLEGANHMALGHIINHPPAGIKPNVLVAAFDWTPQESRPELRALIPNVEFGPEPRLDRNAPVPGLALVAARELSNEELFLNYRLNPNLPSLPEWYSSVDPEEDARRWS